MEFVFSDGGRSKYFKAEKVGDCVCRAICNATGKDYKEVYDGLKALASKERITKRHKKRSSVRDGTYKKTSKKYMQQLGWTWHPCMTIGSGCAVHMKADELPAGDLVVALSKHWTCVKDGVIYDTYDCSRNGTRCVYGYFVKEQESEPLEEQKSGQGSWIPIIHDAEGNGRSVMCSECEEVFRFAYETCPSCAAKMDYDPGLVYGEIPERDLNNDKGEC